MRITVQTLLIAAGVALGIFLLWAVWFWQPERTVTRAFESLVAQVERRNWDAVAKKISDSYEDRWGMNREEAISLGSEGLRHFLFLEIEPADPLKITTREDGAIEIQTPLRISGTGSAIAAMIIDRGNALPGDFQFVFQKESWKPWDWRLVFLDQPQLEFHHTW